MKITKLPSTLVVEPAIDGLSVTLQYERAEPAPAHGAEWDAQQDWPGVRARVTVDYDMLTALVGGSLMGSEITLDRNNRGSWGYGNFQGNTCYERYLEKTFRAPTLNEAESTALEYLRSELEKLFVDVVAPRAERLARRAATIAAAHATRGEFVEPPPTK